MHDNNESGRLVQVLCNSYPLMALCDQFQINSLIALEQHTFSHAGQPSCIYGDPAYPLQVHLQAPQRHAVMTPHMQEFNTFTSAVRTSVKWLLGDINYEKKFKNWSLSFWQDVYSVSNFTKCSDLSLPESNILF